jgi:aryl-alcohol dehydrogenase-like predicted oxidoreductase
LQNPVNAATSLKRQWEMNMEYRNLGRSGLKISQQSLGTMNFSGEGFFGMAGSVTLKDANRLVDIAVDHGVNMLDTSNAYTRGKSEEALGDVLKGRSDQLMVGTKVRFAMGDGPNEQGLSRFHIIHEAGQGALHRLFEFLGLAHHEVPSRCRPAQFPEIRLPADSLHH